MKPAIRYLPPKSSIWGHRLQRMKPTDFRRCTAAFMSEAVREHEVHCEIILPDVASKGNEITHQLVEDIRERTGTRASSMQPQALSEPEFNTCLDLFVASQPLIPRIPFLALNRRYVIRAWNFGDTCQPAVEGGILTEAYGSIQMLGTLLAFRSLEEYRWLKDVTHRIFGIEFNDKHVRPKSVLS